MTTLNDNGITINLGDYFMAATADVLHLYRLLPVRGASFAGPCRGGREDEKRITIYPKNKHFFFDHFQYKTPIRARQGDFSEENHDLINLLPWAAENVPRAG